MSLAFWLFAAVVPLFLVALAFPWILNAWEELGGAIRNREWIALSDLLMRGSLWILLVPASLLALWAVYVAPMAMVFVGGAPNLYWAVCIFLPACIIAALEWSKSSHTRTIACFVGLWTIAALIVLRVNS